MECEIYDYEYEEEELTRYSLIFSGVSQADVIALLFILNNSKDNRSEKFLDVLKNAVDRGFMKN